MAKNIYDEKFISDSRKLCLTIYAFLLDEQNKTNELKTGKPDLNRAVNSMKKFSKFRFANQAALKMAHPLQRIFADALHPIPVKNRISSDFHRRQGNDFLEAKLFKLAEAEYTEAIHLDPKNAISYCNRAACKIGLRTFVDAVKDCYKALELDKNYTKAYCWLGLAHCLMDNPALAFRYYQKALAIEPNNPVCIANMDFIRKNLNHQSLRVYKPLFRYQQNELPVVAKTANSNQMVLQNKSGGDLADSKMLDELKNLKIENFVGKLNSAVLAVEKP